MYKVKPADRIPTRTIEQAQRLDDGGGICGARDSQQAKAYRLYHEIEAQGASVTPETAPAFIRKCLKLADLATNLAKDHAVCAAGCSYCCFVNVSISRLEAEYIAHHTGREIVREAYDRDPSDTNKTYCPFHDDRTASCSIYTYRPIVCRGFYAFDDPKYCKASGTAHGITTADNIPATKWLMDAFSAMSGEAPRDMRYWFGDTGTPVSTDKEI